MSQTNTLYDTDLVAWSKQQAEELRSTARRGANQALDWANIAEEIESLGKSQVHNLKSQIRRIIQHLLKLQHSLSTDPRRGWIITITGARTEIEALLDDSPSLKSMLSSAVAEEHKRGARMAIVELQTHNEVDPVMLQRVRQTTYTMQQVLGDWFPPEPDAGEAARR